MQTIRENFQVPVMNMPLILALAWLAAFALAVHLGVPVPDNLGWVVFFVTLWSLAFLFFGACRRWPLVGWLTLGFIAGLFGAGYHTHTTTVVEREYDDSDCFDRDSCDGNA
jgi:hypothetical protein